MPIPIPPAVQRTPVDYRLVSQSVGGGANGEIPLSDVVVAVPGGQSRTVKADTMRVAYGMKPVAADGLPAGNTIPVVIDDLAADLAALATEPKLGADGPAYAQKAAQLMTQTQANFYWHGQLKLYLAGLAEKPAL